MPDFLQNCRMRLRRLLRADFLRKEDGAVAVETIIVLPAMFFAFLTIFAIFDAFRVYSINQKSTFTIGDAISRETQPIDDAYLTGAWNLFEYLARADETALRVSMVRWDATNNRHRTDWSETRGWVQPLNSADVRDWRTKLPLMVDGERLIIVETWNRFNPPFRTGLEDQEIRNFVFTRPRYAPRVCWETCN